MIEHDDTAEPKRLIAERRYGDAIVACKQLLVTGRVLPEVQILLGQALLAEERFDDVRVEMLALVRRHPEKAEAHRLLGEAYLRSGHKDRAEDALKRALALVPDDVTARELLDELEGEKFPVAHTIERWFGADEGRTVETELPAFEEENTPVPGPLPQAPSVPMPAAQVASIEVDPSLAEEADRLRRARPVRASPSIAAVDTAASRPSREEGAEGLRQILARAPAKPISAPLAAPVGSSSGRGPEGTHVARPTGKGLPSPRPPSASAIRPPPPSAPMEVEPATTELAMPDLLESVSDQVPAPIAESDELELTRPLPPLSSADLQAAAEFRAGGRNMPSGLPPPRAMPPSVRPRDPDPRALPSFGPPAPLPVIAMPRAIAPLPPVPRLPLPAAAAATTAPEIELPPAVQRPPTVPVPPTAMHVPASPVAPRAAPDRKRIAIGAGLVALVGLVVLVIAWLSGPSALDEAFAVVSNDGRPRSFEAALALAPEDGSDEERTLRALLFANMTLELGVDHDADAERLLATLEGEASGTSEARIARSLIALGRGQGGQSLTVLSGLTATGVILVEAFRARALALAQVGTLTEAVDAARQAATLAPGAPRHAALYAELAVLNRDASSAQRVLDGVIGVDELASLRLVRAELGVLTNADPGIVNADLDALLGPLAAVATGPEMGRGHLCRARLALSRGDLEGARTALELAMPLIPRQDLRRRLSLAEAFLAAGVPARALEVAGALTGETSDPTGRAEIVVRAALGAGDLAAAERAVGMAGAGPRIDLLRAQIAEANGRSDEARTLYAQAAVDPTLVVPARTAEGRLLLAANRPREALVALTQALGVSPAAPETVLYFVRAAIASGDVAAAERAVATASATHGEAAEILAATALAASARGHFDLAHASLERAVAARPGDAELRIDLGDAALSLSRLDDAAAAYTAASAMVPAPPRAFLRLASLGIERGELDVAEAHLARATGASELDRARLRARLLVARGAGRSGVEEVTRLRGRTGDVVLTTALAALYVQAEEERTAKRFVLSALRSDRDDPEALLLQALIDAHEGRASASRTLDSAERSAASHGAPPSLRARIAALRGRIAFDDADRDGARAHAEEALRIDAHCAEAQLLLADLEIEGERDPVPALRAAVAGTAPPGEAYGRLALRLGQGEEGCALGRQFLTIAPSGYDARNVRELLEDCP